MHRFLLAIAAVLPLALAGCGRPDQGEAQSLVDRATLTVQDMMNQTVSQDPRLVLRDAKAVMVCPQLFKAGFLFAGEGGGCVLLTRAGNGTWSYPAFYAMGSGSFGFQAGIKDSALLMMVMTQRGVNAVLDSQFKLGADASIAVATVGATVQGATTAAVGADIVAFAYSRGLFAGISLDGSIMSSRTDWNQAYYGQPFAARQIVMTMQGVNRGADPLREVLTRYGSGRPTAPPMGGVQGGPGYAPAYPPTNPPPGYRAPPASYQPPPSQERGPGYGPSAEAPDGAAPIQQQALPPR
jgi:lipid-binding SYLF domain-containing protein